MATIILLSGDESLIRKVRSLAKAQGLVLHSITRLPAAGASAPKKADPALPERPDLALIDLNLGDGVLPWIADAGSRPRPPRRIAFLDHFVGDLPVRAKLAGADRVIARSQVEAELSKLLRQL